MVIHYEGMVGSSNVLLDCLESFADYLFLISDRYYDR